VEGRQQLPDPEDNGAWIEVSELSAFDPRHHDYCTSLPRFVLDQRDVFPMGSRFDTRNGKPGLMGR
jgi:hypothetical protein